MHDTNLHESMLKVLRKVLAKSTAESRQRLRFVLGQSLVMSRSLLH